MPEGPFQSLQPSVCGRLRRRSEACVRVFLPCLRVARKGHFENSEVLHFDRSCQASVTRQSVSLCRRGKAAESLQRPFSPQRGCSGSKEWELGELSTASNKPSPSSIFKKNWGGKKSCVHSRECLLSHCGRWSEASKLPATAAPACNCHLTKPLQ